MPTLVNLLWFIDLQTLSFVGSQLGLDRGIHFCQKTIPPIPKELIPFPAFFFLFFPPFSTFSPFFPFVFPFNHPFFPFPPFLPYFSPPFNFHISPPIFKKFFIFPMSKCIPLVRNVSSGSAYGPRVSRGFSQILTQKVSWTVF